jgi:hypothetical protein
MYLVHTFYKLPPSKHLWPDLSGLKTLIERILRARPKDFKFDIQTDLEPSIRVYKIDVEQCPEWPKLFIESQTFNWYDLKMEVKKVEIA